MLKFAAKLAEESTDIEQNFATTIFYVEKYLGACITTEYPLMKFFSQAEELQKHLESKKREYDKVENRSSTIGKR